MSLKGGYKILDLSQNPSYTEIAKVLNTEKAVLVSGLVVSDVKQKDCFASVEKNGDVFTLKTPDKIITIDDTNGIIVKENTYELKYKRLFTGVTGTLTTITGGYNYKFNLTDEQYASYIKYGVSRSLQVDVGMGGKYLTIMTLRNNVVYFNLVSVTATITKVTIGAYAEGTKYISVSIYTEDTPSPTFSSTGTLIVDSLAVE